MYRFVYNNGNSTSKKESLISLILRFDIIYIHPSSYFVKKAFACVNKTVITLTNVSIRRDVCI